MVRITCHFELKHRVVSTDFSVRIVTIFITTSVVNITPAVIGFMIGYISDARYYCTGVLLN